MKQFQTRIFSHAGVTTHNAKVELWNNLWNLLHVQLSCWMNFSKTYQKANWRIRTICIRGIPRAISRRDWKRNWRESQTNTPVCHSRWCSAEWGLWVSAASETSQRPAGQTGCWGIQTPEWFRGRRLSPCGRSGSGQVGHRGALGGLLNWHLHFDWAQKCLCS